MTDLAQRLAAILRTDVVAIRPLGSGATGSVSLAELESGARVVVKTSRVAEGDGLQIEARMLRLLADRSALPVPKVIHAERDLLVMEYRRGGSASDPDSQRHAAELLASLHAITSDDGRYGLEFDGLIGPLHQPNKRTSSWVEFWCEHRVRHMAELAAKERQINTALAARLERLAVRLNEFIPDRPRASLIHGDVWSGNVLAEPGRITAFIDPAPYYAHHEVELAFITMFSTFGREFFDRYSLVGTEVDAEFWRTRRHVYMVYPLLVHMRLFGSGYVPQLSSTLDMLGI